MTHSNTLFILVHPQGYKQQHNAFVQHATGQIQGLEQQKQQIEQQTAAATVSAAAAVAG